VSRRFGEQKKYKLKKKTEERMPFWTNTHMGGYY
jgi:hypothetical protein